MTEPHAVCITLLPRHDILAPIATAATGEVARSLALRLLDMDDDQLGQLRGAGGDSVLAVLGEANALPWVDGAIYLGRDPAAPRLLIPTMLRPDIASDVFERAIAARMGTAPAPWAVLPEESLSTSAHPRPLLVSVAAGLTIDRASLRAWLEARP